MAVHEALVKGLINRPNKFQLACITPLKYGIISYPCPLLAFEESMLILDDQLMSQQSP